TAAGGARHRPGIDSVGPPQPDVGWVAAGHEVGAVELRTLQSGSRPPAARLRVVRERPGPNSRAPRSAGRWPTDARARGRWLRRGTDVSGARDEPDQWRNGHRTGLDRSAIYRVARTRSPRRTAPH